MMGVGIFLRFQTVNSNSFRSQKTIENDNSDEQDIYSYKLQTSEYSSSIKENGGDINISLYQVLSDTSLKSIVNTSDSNNNTFTVSSPYDKNFNSSYTYIEIGEIISHNKTIVIEESAPGNGTEDTVNGDLAASFTVEEDLYLENISVFLTTSKNKEATVEVGLYNSSWDPATNASIPGALGTYKSIGNFTYVTPVGSALVSWIEIRNLHYYLNNSLTENYTWFISIIETGGPPSAHPSWHYVDDIYNGDNSYSYHHQGGASRDWGADQPHDFTLVLTLNKAAKSTSPDSAEIGLKINGTNIIGTNGQGTWNTTEILGSNSGGLEFNITADWDDVECNVTLVQINYTKTNLKANSSFTVEGSGQDILWNVSRSNGFNLFDNRFENYAINYTIPSNWNNINVFNGSMGEFYK